MLQYTRLSKGRLPFFPLRVCVCSPVSLSPVLTKIALLRTRLGAGLDSRSESLFVLQRSEDDCSADGVLSLDDILVDV